MSELTHPGPAGVDPDAFRDALSRWASGVTVVTARGPEGRVGLTASAFSSLSLHPPLILVCIGHASSAHDVLCAAEGFAVHLLREDQQDVSNRFARSSEDKFAGLEVETGAFGAPLLDDVLARMVCERHDVFDGGDHSILVGRVLGAETHDATPLLYWRGGYRALTPG
ncbi:MAG: flavin reductase family protein [Thermoleophilia bacterium]|nr:flavin reductase family protein [Thermoleophilia bacterium]